MNTDETKSTHRRWVGVVLSLLIPGAGLFFAGKRKEGMWWLVTLTALSFVTIALASLSAVRGQLALAVVFAFTLSLMLWMLVRSCRPVQRLGLKGWIFFLVFVIAIDKVETVLSHQLTLAFRLPTGSMEPTIQKGDRLVAQTSAYWFSSARRGDVVVFRTEQWDAWHIPKGQFFVKRVAGLPGETVQIKEGRLIVNGQPIQGLNPLAGTNFEVPGIFFPSRPDTFVVPANRYFVVGDNATNSLDSRYYGCIARESIIGKATKIYWPRAHATDIE